jgi:hypothetical protein
VGKGVDSPKNHMAQEGALGNSGLTPLMKPQQVRYKLEAIEKPCSDILAHTQKCVKVFCRINGCLATKDNHDSRGMCTTSAECRAVMTTMLIVMRGMDPHTIRVTEIGMVGMLGWLVSCSLGLTAAVDSGRFDIALRGEGIIEV